MYIKEGQAIWLWEKICLLVVYVILFILWAIGRKGDVDMLSRRQWRIFDCIYIARWDKVYEALFSAQLAMLWSKVDAFYCSSRSGGGPQGCTIFYKWWGGFVRNETNSCEQGLKCTWMRLNLTRAKLSFSATAKYESMLWWPTNAALVSRCWLTIHSLFE